MLKFLKELFGFGSNDADKAPYKMEPPTLVPAADIVDQPTSVQADPVAVALDLEPMDFAAATPLADKKPRKPRAPKTAAIKAPAKRGRGPKKAK